MTLACPECGAPAPADAAPGKAYACPRCRNPVLAADRPAPPPPPRPPPGPTRSPRSWRLAAIAFVVLGAAYFGAYELLTADAKRERANLLRVYGEALTTATEPGPVPSAEDPERLRAYLAARDVWDARRTYEARGGRIHAMLGAMLGAFGVQTALTVLLVVKARRAPSPPPRA